MGRLEKYTGGFCASGDTVWKQAGGLPCAAPPARLSDVLHILSKLGAGWHAVERVKTLVEEHGRIDLELNTLLLMLERLERKGHVEYKDNLVRLREE